MQAEIGRLAAADHAEALRLAVLAAKGKAARKASGRLARRYPTDEALRAALLRYREAQADAKLRRGAHGDLYTGWMTLAAKFEGVKIDTISAEWERLKDF